MQEARCFVKSFWVLHLRTFLVKFKQRSIGPRFFAGECISI